jgi:hypothetical protein
MAMDWVRLERSKEIRRMEKSSQEFSRRHFQHKDNRNITNGALTSGARQLGRVNDRPCVARFGGSRGTCSRVG